MAAAFEKIKTGEWFQAGSPFLKFDALFWSMRLLRIFGKHIKTCATLEQIRMEGIKGNDVVNSSQMASRGENIAAAIEAFIGDGSTQADL